MSDTSAGGSVTAVCIVHGILPDPNGEVGTTAIDKRPVEGAVEVSPTRFGQDRCVDVRHHGGPDQVVYAYADEDAAYWAGELGREITPGLFGENLRISGLDVNGAEIGERWAFGAGTPEGTPDGGDDRLVLEVTAPRIPCVTFQYRMGEQHWVKRFTQHGAAGAYLRVVVPGPVSTGDQVEVVHRPGHGVSVRDVFLDAEPEAMRRLLAAERDGGLELHPTLRDRAVKAVARADAG